MSADKKKQYEYDAKWKKENTVLVALRLTRKKDTDIIDALEGEGSMQSKLRYYLRLGIAHEQGTPAPQPDPETDRLVRIGREYEKMLAAGWKLTPPQKEKTEEKKQELRNDYGFERTASGLPDLRKVKRWNEEEKNEEEKEK